MTYRVIGDQDACIAARQCSSVAPEVFTNDEDGLVVVRDATPAEELRESAEYAVRICPAQAIRLAHG
jgi:ferredoxin